MKQHAKRILSIVLITLLFACSENRKEKIQDARSSKNESPGNNKNGLSKEEETATTNEPSATNTAVTMFSLANANTKDATANQFISSSAAVETGKDSTRKFIRTADLKFKVKSVINATYSIENITREQDGFVASTNLSSNIDYTTTTAVSADSSVESTYFTVVNEMILRVPNKKLDTTLKSIATLIDYLDYRNIKAEDVALKILSNKLAQDRASSSEQRLKNAIDNRGKKLTETTDAEQLLTDRQEQADNAKIANLSLQDQINFSTIKLELYQRQAIKRELVSDNKNINAYKPGLGSRIAEAWRTGWEVLKDILVFIAQTWGFILLCVIVYIIYKLLRNKRRE